MNLLKSSKYYTMIGYIAAGSTMHASSVVLDTAGYEGVQFIGSIGTVTAAGVIQVRPTHVAGSSTGTQVAISDAYAGTTSSTTAMTNKCIVSDIYKPSKRWMSVQLHRATQNAVINAVVAVLYKAHKMPVTQPTGTGGVIDDTQTASPTTG